MTKNLDLPDLARGSIVVGVDGSDGSDEAVDWAADLAARSRRALTVLHTEAPPVPWNAVGYTGDLSAAPTLRESVLAAGGRITDAASERARTRHPDLELGAVTGTVDPRRGLVEASHRAHLIVLGSRGRGPLASVLLGSVSREVSRSAACPVVVIRPGSHTGDHVLALVDGTPASLDVMEFAARQASDLQLPLRVDWAPAPDDREVATVRRWERRDWGDEGTTMAWCCTEGDRAYVGDQPVIESLAPELEALVGTAVHVELRRRLDRA